MSRSRSIEMGGKNSLADFGWEILTFTASAPEKRRATVTVPFRSGSYDFDAIYGRETYSDRTIDVVFMRKIELGKDSEQVAEFVRWLYAPENLPAGSRYQIIDKQLPEWSYRGKCVSAVPTCAGVRLWQINARFVVDPFRSYYLPASMVEEKTPLLALNETYFDLGTSGTQEFELVNLAPTAIDATISATATVQVWIQGLYLPSASLGMGDPDIVLTPTTSQLSPSSPFTLPAGGCRMKISGSGSVSVNWIPLAI